jgi:hypothetical protein
MPCNISTCQPRTHLVPLYPTCWHCRTLSRFAGNRTQKRPYKIESKQIVQNAFIRCIYLRRAAQVQAHMTVTLQRPRGFYPPKICVYSNCAHTHVSKHVINMCECETDMKASKIPCTEMSRMHTHVYTHTSNHVICLQLVKTVFGQTDRKRMASTS